MFKPEFKNIYFQISAQTIYTYILMHFLIKPVFSITEKQKNMVFLHNFINKIYAFCKQKWTKNIFTYFIKNLYYKTLWKRLGT